MAQGPKALSGVTAETIDERAARPLSEANEQVINWLESVSITVWINRFSQSAERIPLATWKALGDLQVAVRRLETQDVEVSPHWLIPILRAAEDPRQIAWMAAIGVLGLLGGQKPVQQAWLNLAAHKRASIRWRTLVGLREYHRLPVHIVEQLLDAALSDSSAKNRGWAVEVTYKHGFAHWADKIDELAKIEKDTALRDYMIECVHLFRHGFYVDPKRNDGLVTLWIRDLDEDVPWSGAYAERVAESDFSAAAIPNLIAEHQQWLRAIKARYQ